ncbi:EamA family transporter [Paenibacillus hodogayensis]|uniref:EamA family transporter n=1 Tax=Paenibacillus hodogayensis TaxID=279208 RepID=A0ABV5W2W6_9BACL
MLSRTSAERANVFLFLIPFFGTLGGWAILGESLHSYIIGGAACIGLGIFLVNRPARAVSGEQRLSR